MLVAVFSLVTLTDNNEDYKTGEEYYKSVVEDNQSESYDGLNLFAERKRSKNVYLMYNNGSLYHTWNVGEEFSERRFNYPLILEGGDLMYVNYKEHLIRYNSSSGVEWKTDKLGHHDLAYKDDTVFGFHRKNNVQSDELGIKLQDDIIKMVDPQTGNVFGKNVSIYEVLSESNKVNLEERYEEELLQGREVENGV